MKKASAKATDASHDFNNINGIVTPSVATNMFRTTSFTQSASGILVCIDELNQNGRECTKDGKKAWRSMPNSVPPGKAYVGFRIVSGYQGSMAVEVYWK